MESFGVPGEINLSERTYEYVKHLFQCEPRGIVEVKGKGQMQMYILERIRPEFSADESGLVPNDNFFATAD
jgi:class 3 adenylate cyclase